MKGVWIVLVYLLSCVFGDTPVESMSEMEGDSVTLHSDVTKGPNDTMLWYFNDSLIALINGDPSKSCLYDGEDGIFRDRLKVDYETGSMIITNITTEHAGGYEAEIIRRDSSGKSQSLNGNPKCNSTKTTKKIKNFGDTIKTFIVTVSARATAGPTRDPTSPVSVTEDGNEVPGLSPAAVAGIVVGVLLGTAAVVVVGVLLVAAAVFGVIYYRRRRSRNAGRRNNEEVRQEVKESFL